MCFEGGRKFSLPYTTLIDLQFLFILVGYKTCPGHEGNAAAESCLPKRFCDHCSFLFCHVHKTRFLMHLSARAEH